MPRTRTAATGAALFAVALAYFALLAPYGLELADEGHLLHQIQRVYLGQEPYADFHTGYSPGGFYLNAWLLQAFGDNLLVIRFSLALLNAASVLLLWWLALRLGASGPGACLAALAYVAFIPFWDGRFAPFNIPYPAWYVTFFWLLAVACILGWWRSGRAAWWLAAGLCAGLVFASKQNSGLLALAVCLISAVLLQRPLRGEEGGGRASQALLFLERSARWAIPVVLTVGFAQVFGGFGPSLPLMAPLAVLLAAFALQGGSAPARPARPGAITRDLALLGLAFGAVNLPWLAYFWYRVGAASLLRHVFYIDIGTPYEQHYLIPYPPFGRWGQIIALGVFAAAFVPAIVRRIGLRARGAILLAVAAGALAAAALWLWPPPMVEGFQASVVMRVRDVSFAVVAVVLWAGIATFLLRVYRPGRARASGVHLVLLLSAVLMHMQIYPRSDFMHLVYAAPGAIVIGAWLLDRWAAELAAALGVAPARRWLARAVLQTPAYGVALILLAPALLRIDYLVRAWASGDPQALVRLEVARAPLVIEPAAGFMFESLSATVSFLRLHTTPDERVFTFPCLDVFTFLADRPDPSRHGYYYPGSPGRAVEAEVIDDMEARPPRYVVTLHDHALFFVGAPVYYFNLRDHVTRAFDLDRRVGLLDVLRPNGNAAEAPPAAESSAESNARFLREMALWQAELRHDRGSAAQAVAAALAEAPPAKPDDLAALILAAAPAEQRVIADLVQKSRSPGGAAALAIAAADPALPEREFSLFVRIIGSGADLRAVPPLVRALDELPPERRGWIAGNLFAVASKAWIETYFYAPDSRLAGGGLPEGVTPGKLIQWTQNRWESVALRSFALRMAGRSNDPIVVPFLTRVAADAEELPQLRSDAAHSLVDLGRGDLALPALATLLRYDETVAPALVAAVHHQTPEGVRALLEAALSDPDAELRRRALWIAGTVRDPALTPLVRQGLDDPSTEVRIAAAWVLARTPGEDARLALDAAGDDPHDEVDRFLERARKRLGNHR